MGFFEVSLPTKRRMAIAGTLPTDHPAALDDLHTVMDTLPDPADLSSDEVVGAMSEIARLRNRCDAYLTALAGEADCRKISRMMHAGTTGTLVAAATGANPAAGSGMVGTARALRDLPAVAAAYRAGHLSGHHVHALCQSAERIDDFAQIEGALVDVAGTVEPAELRRILTVLIGQSQPDEAERSHAKQRDKRGLNLSETPSGMFRLDGWLDALEGRRLRDALIAFTDRRQPGDDRTTAARRADALSDILATVSANTRPLGVSQLTVLVDIANLPDGHQAVLEDGHVLTRASYDLLACCATLAVLFGTSTAGTFVPLALGRSARRAVRGQWAALIARDRGCIRCGRAPGFCESHHVVHWKDGGATDVSNLVLLCSRCHHDLHHGDFTITMVDGVPVIRATRSPPIRAG